MNRVSPPYLKKGDRIAIAATARKVSREEVEPATRILSSWGLEVVVQEELFAADHQFAGSDAHRAQCLQRYVDDPTIKAIICARGGYGTVRIIDQLDFSAFVLHPKWIIGYSDITVLHAHIHRHLLTNTLHATMPLNMQLHNADEESIAALKRALFGERLSYSFDVHALNRAGEAGGQLVGGNLSVLYSLLGSASDMDVKGKILFLEDLDEYVYHIDRMVVNLQRNGKLEGLAGLVVGGMNDMKDNVIPFGKTAEEIIHEHVKGYGYPVCFGFPAGHEKRNLPLVMGGHARLVVGPGGCELSFD